MTTSITPCAAALIPPFRRLPAGLPWPSETSAECKRHLTLAAQRVTLLSGMKLARGWRVTDKRPSNGEQFVFVLLADDVSASEAACRCSACGGVCARTYVPGCSALLLNALYFLFSTRVCDAVWGRAQVCRCRRAGRRHCSGSAQKIGRVTHTLLETKLTTALIGSALCADG